MATRLISDRGRSGSCRPRALHIERLESRTLLSAGDWQNPLTQYDVNDNGIINPTDAVDVIREILTHGSRPLVEPRNPLIDKYVDVTGDNYLNTRDSVQLIQFLITRKSAPPLDLQLHADTGISSTDRLTQDGRVDGGAGSPALPVTTAKVRVNDGPVFDVEVTGGTFQIDPLTLPGVDPGKLKVRVLVEPEPGHLGLKMLQFTVDRTSPGLSLTSFVPPVLLGNLTFLGLAVDLQTGPAIVSAQFDDDPSFDVPVSATNDFEFESTFALDGSDNGPHRLRLWAADRAGNTTELPEITFTLAATAPGPLSAELVDRVFA